MKPIPMTLSVASVAVAAFVAGGWLAPRLPAPAERPEVAQVQSWTCPMHREVRRDGPGQCPICGMALIQADAAPVSAHDHAIHIDPGLVQRLGMRLVEVRRQTLSEAARVPLQLAYDERERIDLQPRVDGYVTRLHLRAAGGSVRAGQTIATVFSAEVAQTVDEWQLLRRRGPRELAAAALERLRRLGVDPARLGRRPGEYLVVAPRAAVVDELLVAEGTRVTAAAPLARLRGIDRLWALAEFREGEPEPAPGQVLSVELAAFPGESFAARALEPLPVLATERRVQPWRLELANPDGRLKPGMLGELSLHAAPREVLAVPEEAVIHTGERRLVIVAEGQHFTPRPVRLGISVDGWVAIRGGLDEGERVVASGQFLIDSEAHLRRALAEPAAAADPHAGHRP